jgi:hypothetical protein
MNQHILEKLTIASGIKPVNLATGNNTGDLVCMKNYGRLAVVLYCENGTATTGDVTITMQQATDAAAGGVKALTFTRVDHKQGTDLEAVGQFTEVTQTAASTYTNTDSGENEQIIVIDVKAEDLDIENNFDWVRVYIAQVGNAKIGAALYILHEPRYGTDPALSVIA